MRQFPNDWRGFNDAGMILFETGKVAQAKADFEKANALSANNKTIKNNLGAVELINGNVKEAEVLFGLLPGAGQRSKLQQRYCGYHEEVTIKLL